MARKVSNKLSKCSICKKKKGCRPSPRQALMCEAPNFEPLIRIKHSKQWVDGIGWTKG